MEEKKDVKRDWILDAAIKIKDYHDKVRVSEILEICKFIRESYDQNHHLEAPKCPICLDGLANPVYWSSPTLREVSDFCPKCGKKLESARGGQ